MSLTISQITGNWGFLKPETPFVKYVFKNYDTFLLMFKVHFRRARGKQQVAGIQLGLRRLYLSEWRSVLRTKTTGRNREKPRIRHWGMRTVQSVTIVTTDPWPSRGSARLIFCQNLPKRTSIIIRKQVWVGVWMWIFETAIVNIM